MKVEYVYLDRQWARERNSLLPLIDRVLSSGQWIASEEVVELEEDLADYSGVNFCVAVNSGTDALALSLHSLGVGPGSRIVVPVNSYVATATSALWLGAEVLFVDVGSDLNISVESLLKLDPNDFDAVVPVHLTGKMAAMKEILSWSSGSKCVVVEDGAQAIGASIGKKKAGGWGRVGAFSLHPLKNLNASGDGGFILTNDESLAEEIRFFRQNGHSSRDEIVRIGTISRLDPVQAAIVRFRLSNLESLIARRRDIANHYRDELAEYDLVLPSEEEESRSVYHTFVVQVDRRDRVMESLFKMGVSTRIHYPVLISDQAPVRKKLTEIQKETPQAKAQAERILSLPISQELHDEEVEYVIKSMKRALDNV